MVGPNVNPYGELTIYKAIQAGTIKTDLDYQPLGQVASAKVVKKIIRSACIGNWLLLDNLQLSLDITANMHKFLETMYEGSRKIKDVLFEQAKSEIEHNLKAQMKNKNVDVDFKENIQLELVLLHDMTLDMTQDSKDPLNKPGNNSFAGDKSTQQISDFVKDKIKKVLSRKK